MRYDIWSGITTAWMHIHRIKHFADVLLSFLYGCGNHLLKSALCRPKLILFYLTVWNVGGSVELS